MLSLINSFGRDEEHPELQNQSKKKTRSFTYNLTSVQAI
jgi:hypothetical protein